LSHDFLLTSCGGSSDVSDTSENNDSILIVTDSANSEETQNENSNLATNSTTPDDGIASDGESVQTENGNSNETSAEGSDGSDISENNNSTPIANSSSSSEETQNEGDNLATDGTAPDDGIASDEEPVQTENGNNNDTSTDAIDDEDESTSNDSANVNPSSPDENRNLIARLTPGGDRQLNETDTNELSGLTLGFENAADTSTFSRVSAITPDGRYVVFASNATNITADGNSGILQLYRHDRETGTNVLVSRSLTGAEGNDASFDAQISADGNTIVFPSSASNLIDGESFERSHVYVHTVQNGETVNITSQLSRGFRHDCRWSIYFSQRYA